MVYREKIARVKLLRNTLIRHGLHVVSVCKNTEYKNERRKKSGTKDDEAIIAMEGEGELS